jgi:lysophospholipase L1-like esterase
MKRARINFYDPNRRGSSRVLLILGLSACLFAAVSVAYHRPESSGRGVSASRSVPVTITWAMAERFGPGYDRNRDGRPDLPNSLGYVNPGRFEVRLTPRVGATAVALVGMSCEWTIDGHGQAICLRANGPKLVVRLPPGAYSVRVSLRLADGRTGSARETIRVKDILVVALGDSLATGEGNPEEPACWEGDENSTRAWALRGRLDPSMPARWADGGPDGNQPRVTPAGILPPANVSHSRAHRSTRSGPAQFAMRLEAEDPHTSVTFVCLAATGARTDDLFRPDRSDQNRALGPGPTLPAQLDELHAIVGSRPADIVVFALGLNDSRAFELLGELRRREVRYIDPLRLLAAYPTRKDWAAARLAGIEELVDPKERRGLNSLNPEARRAACVKDAGLIYDLAESATLGLVAPREQFDRLAKAIAKDSILAGAEVLLLEYPDPTGDATGATGTAMLDDLVPGMQVNRRELDLVRESLLRPVNSAIREAADRQGWSHVAGIFEAFRNHGYAAKETWFRRAKESEQLQGPRLSIMGYIRGELAPGTLHPNHLGHQVIADRLFLMLTARETSHLDKRQDVTSGLSRSDTVRIEKNKISRSTSPPPSTPESRPSPCHRDLLYHAKGR